MGITNHPRATNPPTATPAEPAHHDNDINQTRTTPAEHPRDDNDDNIDDDIDQTRPFCSLNWMGSRFPGQTPAEVASNSPIPPLVDSFIIATVSSRHTCNDRDRFVTYQHLNPEVHRLYGLTNASIPIYGKGTVIIHPKRASGNGEGTLDFELRDVVHTPDMPVNTVSPSLLGDEFGYSLGGYPSAGVLFREGLDGRVENVAEVVGGRGYFCLEYKEADPVAYTARVGVRRHLILPN